MKCVLRAENAHKNAFVTEAPPRTPLRELTVLSRPSWGRKRSEVERGRRRNWKKG